ncbi:MAG: RNA methyltransferase [Bacteroidales bacterium]|jgi:23S rRNA (guanosine2251-2'-O)-methyltransferase|nr:RNA methyltransferase [Bacteroidales bacterium]
MRKLKNSELNRKSVEEFRESVKSPFIIVLDNVRSNNNVGSIFRTSDAFLTEGIYLCGITGRPPHREINKTALGATETVMWKYFKTTIEAVSELKALGYKIVGIEQAEGSVDLGSFRVKKGVSYALVFGNEVNGVDQKILDECDYVVEIPQFGTKHSFNIAVSAGIVLWELTKTVDESRST